MAKKRPRCRRQPASRRIRSLTTRVLEPSRSVTSNTVTVSGELCQVLANLTALLSFKRTNPTPNLRDYEESRDGLRCCPFRRWPRRAEGASPSAVCNRRATPASVEMDATLRARGRNGLWRCCGSVTARSGDAPSPRLAIGHFSLSRNPSLLFS